jgi:predicted  nucleic acid-binding Zn ribbon protein
MDADTGHYGRCVLQAKCGQMQANIRGKETESVMSSQFSTQNSPLFQKKKKKSKKTQESKKDKNYYALIHHSI